MIRNFGWDSGRRLDYVPLITKDTTGDPVDPLREGSIIVNQADKTVKIYAGGALRTLCSW